MKWDLPPIPSHEEIDNRPVKYMVCLLNLVLSCIAAIQAPVILMSQNRQEEKDRVRAEHDYRLVHQWQRLIEIQQVQTDLLSELRSPKSGS